jgi:Fe-S-cluster containining protein
MIVAPTPDCQDCGACCREAYHAVEVADDDPVHQARPDVLVCVDNRWQIRRTGNRCSCLAGELGSFRCTVYDERPQCCRDFTWDSDNCREARQRVGLPV